MYILTSNKKKIPRFLRKYSIIEFLEGIPINSKVLCFSYNKIISKENISKFYLYNVHNSLLPKYRGLHAFTWGIINNERKFGYTVHIINEKIDQGDIISQISFDLYHHEDINDLFRKGNKILKNWLPKVILDIKMNNIKPVSQKTSNQSYFRKRNENDNRIYWGKSSLEIYNLIRAVSPPYTEGAYLIYENTKIYVHESEIISEVNKGDIGEIIEVNPIKGISIKTSDSAILIKKFKVNNKQINDYKIFKIGKNLLAKNS